MSDDLQPNHTSTLRLMLPVLFIAVVGAGIGGLIWYRQATQHIPGVVPLKPVDAVAIRSDVLVLSSLDPVGLAKLLEPNEMIRAAAYRAARDQASLDGKARAVCAALQERKNKGAFVDWSRVDPREGPPLTAAETFQALSLDGAQRHLYPLELAALGVAGLRSLGVPALVVEVYRYPKERSALDPSGRLGYYAVLVPAHDAAPARVYDPYGGRMFSPNAADYGVLNDAQAIGAALSLRAIHELVNAVDPNAAAVDSEAALKLLSGSPAVHSVRAAVLAAQQGSGDAGEHELNEALTLRPDAARHNNLAMHWLSRMDPGRATGHVKAALTELPDYALAHVTLATLYLTVEEEKLTRSELEKADALDPSLALTPQIWAQYYASQMKYDEALSSAQEALRRRPRDPQALFILARIEHHVDRNDDVRAHAAAILARVAPDNRAHMMQVLRGALGDNAVPDPPTLQLQPASTAPSASQTPPHP